MKRTIAMLLAVLMLVSLAACGGKKDDVSLKLGLLETESQGGHKDHEAIEHADRASVDLKDVEYVYYNNLVSAIMDLSNGKVSKLALEKSSAAYVVARNEMLTFVSRDDSGYETAFSMMTMDTNQEVYDILNNAIVELKADGTLNNLIEKELKAYINTDPEAKELPHYDGAKTIKIGVTGDMPPMDFVDTDGKASGFNIALLTEIANRAQVNFELVQVETGARAMALSSGKVDAVFWTKSVTCIECNEAFTENIAGTLVTESYFAEHQALVVSAFDK